MRKRGEVGRRGRGKKRRGRGREETDEKIGER